MAKIRHYKGEKDAWICICKNEPFQDGFYECDKTGRQVEAVDGKWDGRLYICNCCGRIIDQRTLKVVGRGTPPHLVESKETEN